MHGEDPAVKTMAAILIAALFSLQNTGLGTEKNTAPHYRAESSAYMVKAKDAWTFVTENRSFRFVEVLSDQGERYAALLLLEETYHNERTDGVEGVQGSATVRAWELNPGRPRELRWTFREAGNEGEAKDRSSA